MVPCMRAEDTPVKCSGQMMWSNAGVKYCGQFSCRITKTPRTPTDDIHACMLTADGTFIQPCIQMSKYIYAPHIRFTRRLDSHHLPPCLRSNVCMHTHTHTHGTHTRQVTRQCTPTEACFTSNDLTTTFDYPFFDLDGQTVKVYAAGSTIDGPSTRSIYCANGRTMDINGCNGPGSALDLPPYALPQVGAA